MIKYKKHRKLTESDIRGAISLYESGLSYGEIARFYNSIKQTIWALLNRREVKSRPQKRYGKDNHFYRGGPLGNDIVRHMAFNAIENGILTPLPCEVCDKTGVMADGRNTIHAHHDDYNKPLDIRWLCQEHHYEWHRSNRPIPKRL